MSPKESQFLEAYDQFADMIFRHCYFRVSDREKAKDLTQQTFMKAWESMTEGEAVLNIKAYLYRIANNLIIDHYRKKKEYSLDSMTEEGFEVADQLSIKDLENMIMSNQLIKVLEELPEKIRDIMVMRYVDDLSVKDIAEMIDETENVVSVRIHRTLKKLKERFNE